MLAAGRCRALSTILYQPAITFVRYAALQRAKTAEQEQTVETEVSIFHFAFTSCHFPLVIFLCTEFQITADK